MADIQSALRLDGVRETIREPLRILAERLAAQLGDNLKSISVVGSGLTDDFQPGTSDINTVVLLEADDSPALNAVASLVKPMSRYRLSPPLLMTSHYIARSRDVFPVEFLDFQLIHETILGEDPFASLQIEKRYVRLQCERELKATLVRLRQGYVASVGNKRMVHDLLISTAKGLTPLLRAVLWLKDIQRPNTMDSVLRKAASGFDVDLNAVIVAERWRYEKPRLTDAEVESTFVAVLRAVDRLTAIVDEFEL